ncbi:hypothetical protein BD309DRAFT_895910, partial [Dichomitus squalens]|uniref:Uncharacterized protein n=1 Tax=Dichomitus squalens TaxID=114155 RepID=A0A4Q9PR01_9APHY
MFYIRALTLTASLAIGSASATSPATQTIISTIAGHWMTIIEDDAQDTEPYTGTVDQSQIFPSQRRGTLGGRQLLDPEARRETGDREQEAGKENRTTLPPIPVQDRGPSLLTEVIEESPVAEVEESAAFSGPLPPSHMESRFVTESGSTMDGTQRTMSHSAFVLAPALTAALLLEADGTPDASRP